jgi:hypothetical protein
MLRRNATLSPRANSAGLPSARRNARSAADGGSSRGAKDVTRVSVAADDLAREVRTMGNAKKWRKKKMAKHKHRKRLKKTRWQRRQRA